MSISSLLGIPSIWQSALAIVGGLVLYFLYQKAKPWLQAYRNRQEQAKGEDARKQAQHEDQQANSDSDTLNQRERDHDGG